LRPYGILEMVRTGVVAMRRGASKPGEVPAVPAATDNGAATIAADDNISYSV